MGPDAGAGDGRGTIPRAAHGDRRPVEVDGGSLAGVTTRARTFGFVLLGGAMAGAGMLLARPPVAGAYPLCPWKAITGTDCPFCGGMRGVAAMIHGDFTTAVDYNLLVAVSVPALLVIAIVAVGLGPRVQPLVDGLFARRGVLVGFGVLLVWFVVRLLPVAPWLSSSVPS